MTPLQRTRIEKAAADCGFERTPELSDGALVLRSAHFPESVLVYPVADRQFELRAEEPALLEATGGDGPASAAVVEGYGALYAALQRAAVTARTRQGRLAAEFHKATASLPKTTEAERLVVQRVGQGLFRDALLKYWNGRCCVTGLAVPELLRASHIKPWAACGSDEERLDVFNGLLLAPHLDAIFDQEWVKVAEHGDLVVSLALDLSARRALGILEGLRIAALNDGHQGFVYHRSMIFRAELTESPKWLDGSCRSDCSVRRK